MRLVVERERERMRFVAAGYWDLVGDLRDRRRVRRAPRRASTGAASRRAATSTQQGKLRTADACRSARTTRARSPTRSTARRSRSQSVEEKPYTRRPTPPFMTSTLQQEASRKLRHQLAAGDARRPAPVRERLHHLHAHRLDDAVRVGAHRGPRTRRASCTAPSTVPAAPRTYDTQGQERAGGARGDPSGRRRFRTPDELRGELTRRRAPPLRPDLEADRRSQMADARGQTVSVRIAAHARGRRATAEFATAGTVITFRGFLLAYEEGATSRPPTMKSASCRSSRKATTLEASELEPTGTRPAAGAVHRGHAREGARGARDRPAVDVRLDHGDDPRPRVRAEAGPGARADVPAFAVVNLLEKHFTRLVDYEFTARWRTISTRSRPASEERDAWLHGSSLAQTAMPG